MSTAYNLPTGDFVTTSLNGPITSGATTATIAGGLNIPATSGILHIDYNSILAIGVSGGPETVSYTSYNTSTGALTGLTRGIAGTTAVAHANTATVQAGPSILYLNQDLANIIQQTAWTAWVPSLTTGSSMTYTSTSISFARYMQLGKLVFCQLDFTGTTGGTPNTTIQFTVPVTPKNTGGQFGGGCEVVDGGTAGVAATFNQTSPGSSTVDVKRYDAANWGAGAGRRVLATVFYEAA